MDYFYFVRAGLDHIGHRTEVTNNLLRTQSLAAGQENKGAGKQKEDKISARQPLPA
jgi:hypothetical protein